MLNHVRQHRICCCAIMLLAFVFGEQLQLLFEWLVNHFVRVCLRWVRSHLCRFGNYHFKSVRFRSTPASNQPAPPLTPPRSARTLAIMSRGNNNVLCCCAKDVRTLQTPNHYSTAWRRHRQQNHGRTRQPWRGEMNIPKKIYVCVCVCSCAHSVPAAAASSRTRYTHARPYARRTTRTSASTSG